MPGIRGHRIMGRHVSFGRCYPFGPHNSHRRNKPTLSKRNHGAAQPVHAEEFSQFPKSRREGGIEPSRLLLIICGDFSARFEGRVWSSGDQIRREWVLASGRTLVRPTCMPYFRSRIALRGSIRSLPGNARKEPERDRSIRMSSPSDDLAWS